MNKLVGLIIFALVLMLMCLNGCSNQNTISIIGSVEETIEAGSEYIDKGVNIPNGYTYLTSVVVNTKILGKQQIIYKVYSNHGELVKELSRFVIVQDTTAPSYIETDIKNMFPNETYSINDFISDYSDNLDNKNMIKTEVITPKNLTTDKDCEVVITLTDSSGNITIYQKKVTSMFDPMQFYCIQEEKGNVTVTNNATVGKYIRIELSNSLTISYFSNNDQLIINKKVSTIL